jgi:hypothetical protein
MVEWKPSCVNDDGVLEAIALDIARRLQTPEQVQAIVAAADAQRGIRSPGMSWTPCSIARGYAGLAIFYSQLDECFPNKGWDRVAHRYLGLAVRDFELEAAATIGLFSGISGLAFTAQLLSRGGRRYQALLQQLDDLVLRHAIIFAANVQRLKSGMGANQLDLVSGLAGIAVYLIGRPDDLKSQAATQDVLSSLVGLILADEDPPRWHTPADLIVESMRSHYPYGHLNCGLAHGIPGPLAVLALAKMANIEVEGIVDSIHRVARWLLAHRRDDQWGLNWPTAVSLNPPSSDVSKGTVDGRRVSVTPSHSGWCYGSPGIARSLWLAGMAVDEDQYRTIAIQAMQSVYRRPPAGRRLSSPTFCHGLAGLLHISLRFSHEVDGLFANQVNRLSAQIASSFVPSSRLGFATLEADGQWIECPGILEGASGVALVLLAAVTKIEPSWDRLVLLS